LSFFKIVFSNTLEFSVFHTLDFTICKWRLCTEAKSFNSRYSRPAFHCRRNKAEKTV